LIDKDRLLGALRNSTQNPRAVELVIHQLEQGEFDVAEATAAQDKKKAPKAPSD
jgi:hypothetical protein